jgi:hypothetical protein
MTLRWYFLTARRIFIYTSMLRSILVIICFDAVYSIYFLYTSYYLYCILVIRRIPFPKQRMVNYQRYKSEKLL